MWSRWPRKRSASRESRLRLLWRKRRALIRRSACCGRCKRRRREAGIGRHRGRIVLTVKTGRTNILACKMPSPTRAITISSSPSPVISSSATSAPRAIAVVSVANSRGRKGRMLLRRAGERRGRRRRRRRKGKPMGRHCPKVVFRTSKD